MTPAPPQAVPKKAPAVQKKAKALTPSGSKIVKKKRYFFSVEPVAGDFVANEDEELHHHHRMQAMVYVQSIVIIILTGILVIFAPVLKPVYHYYARDPAGNNTPLGSLIMPNMTNHAVISWALTSVTEIMTFGFGDIISQLSMQRPRFTTSGWESFVAAFHRQEINETFKQNQLVLTTVPSDTAVILSQGQNESGIYQWRVQVPVVMTYATNNNMTKPHRGIITLTIVRVQAEQNPAGIAIKNWTVDR